VIVEAAARRRVHVYADKPMAATLAQADRMLAAAEAAGITLMIAYHPVFGAQHGQVRALIAAGAVGKPYLARGVIGHGGPREYGCSEYFCAFLFDKQRNGGGAFVDEACYMVDTFVDYLGPVAEVSAFTTQIGFRDYLPADVEDNSVAILRFASGALGVIDAKWGKVGPMPLRTSFHGTHGTVLTSQHGAELYTKLAGDLPVPDGWQPIDVASLSMPPAAAAGLRGWRAPGGRAPGSGSGGAEQRAFVNHVLHGLPLEHGAQPRTARHVQEVIEAVYRSAATGRAVQLPLA
jgi:predicted dehydrogenase